ncbi:MAG TPA: energy transducer TonB [Gemmatimonadaceae bacterium]|nr:energy transducer TonB [Gemmatimonadaceae bacterium]
MRALSVLLMAAVHALPVAGQQSDSARCDSIVGASRADSVQAALFLSVRRVDGPPFVGEQAHRILTSIGSGFVAPRPFRLNVFSGPSLARTLRVRGGDTAVTLRAPTVTAIYRVTTSAAGIEEILVTRAGLMTGFDSAAVDAIRTGAVANPAFAPLSGDYTTSFNVVWSTDSTAGAMRLASAQFPRMPVVDASALENDPPPPFPPAARANDLDEGEVVLRFVIDLDGLPNFDTIELVRSTDASFTRAALVALSKHRFRPATIRGCAVAQQVEYAMTFSLPEPPTH